MSHRCVDVRLSTSRCVCTHAHASLVGCVLQHVLLARQCIPNVVSEVLRQFEMADGRTSQSQARFYRAYTELERCLREMFSSGRRGGVLRVALVVGQSELLFTDVYSVHLPPAHCAGLADDGCGLLAPPEALTPKERQRISLALYQSSLCAPSTAAATSRPGHNSGKAGTRVRVYALARRSAGLADIDGMAERPDLDLLDDGELLRRRNVNVRSVAVTHGPECDAVAAADDERFDEGDTCWYAFEHTLEPVVD